MIIMSLSLALDNCFYCSLPSSFSQQYTESPPSPLVIYVSNRCLHILCDIGYIHEVIMRMTFVFCFVLVL